MAAVESISAGRSRRPTPGVRLRVAIVGKALYEGRFDLADAIAALAQDTRPRRPPSPCDLRSR